MNRDLNYKYYLNLIHYFIYFTTIIIFVYNAIAHDYPHFPNFPPPIRGVFYLLILIITYSLLFIRTFFALNFFACLISCL